MGKSPPPNIRTDSFITENSTHWMLPRGAQGLMEKDHEMGLQGVWLMFQRGSHPLIRN